MEQEIVKGEKLSRDLRPHAYIRKAQGIMRKER